MLYAIQVGDDGPVKLGTAGDPVARLRALQTSHHSRLRLRAAWAGAHRDEQALHARFAAARLRGEWFAWTPELRTFVGERAAAMTPELTWMIALLESAGSLAQKPARERREAALGVRPGGSGREARISGWFSGGLPHPRWDDHVMLDPRERRDADEWVAVLCDLVPTLGVRRLLTYLELVACADADGLAEIALATIEQRVIGHPDRRAAGELVDAVMALVLPAEDSPYQRHGLSKLVTEMRFIRQGCHVRVGSLDPMCVAASVSVRLVHFGAGFGREALPGSFPVDDSFAARHAWAREQIIAAERRLAERRREAQAA